MLDINTDRLRAVAESVRNAAVMLSVDLPGAEVQACGGDETSQAIMGNLNARQRWLTDQLKAGHGQSLHAADGVEGTAVSYESEDSAIAEKFGGSGSAAPAASGEGSAAAPAVPPAPSMNAIPDISHRDGESLATQLEAGAGPGPATIAAGRWSTVAGQANAAALHYSEAQGHLMASGQSGAHQGLLTKLVKAQAWSENMAAHSLSLSDGYATAASAHTAVQETVGTSIGWRTLKTAYDEAQAENKATFGAAQPRVDGLANALNVKQQTAESGMKGLQTTGEALSTVPAGAPDPNLDPNGKSNPADAAGPEDPMRDKKHDDAKEPTGEGSSGLLGSVMGALGPVAQTASQVNPLKSVGEAVQQVGQQVGQLGKAAHPGAAPLKPAALGAPHSGIGKGGKGIGGGGGIKGGAGISPSMRPAALNSPAATPASTPAVTAKADAMRGGATPSATGGMGMMPMGARPGGDKSAAVKSKYPEQPAPEIKGTGRAGVVGNTTPAVAEPVVNPETVAKRRDRIAQRKKDIADSSGP